MHITWRSNTELVLIREVAEGGGAHKLDVLWDDNEVEEERRHHCLHKKRSKVASRFRIAILGVKGRPAVNHLVNNYRKNCLFSN